MEYEGRGECIVKGSGSKGCVSRRLLSGKFLVPWSSDCFAAIYRDNEECGGSAARNLIARSRLWPKGRRASCCGGGDFGGDHSEGPDNGL